MPDSLVGAQQGLGTQTASCRKTDEEPGKAEDRHGPELQAAKR